MKGDASFRTYTRLVRDGGESALLMNAPPERENIAAYLKITEYLRVTGCRVPAIYAQDMDRGFALIEDFGDETFTTALRSGLAAETALYLMAVEVLIHIHRHVSVLDVTLGAYDMAALRAELDLYLDWFVPELRGSEVSDKERADWNRAWDRVLEPVAARRDVMVLRDYHVDNLMVTDTAGGGAIGACGLLDYQDAVVGVAAYDLVSLVQDARRDVSATTVKAVFDTYINAGICEDAEGAKAGYGYPWCTAPRQGCRYFCASVAS